MQRYIHPSVHQSIPYIHTYIHTYVRAYVHTYTYTYIHTLEYTIYDVFFNSYQWRREALFIHNGGTVNGRAVSACKACTEALIVQQEGAEAENKRGADTGKEEGKRKTDMDSGSIFSYSQESTPVTQPTFWLTSAVSSSTIYHSTAAATGAASK